MKKGAYSKWLIAAVIVLNIGFAIGVMIAVKNGATEPETLINRWFDWTTAEIFAVSGVKITKIIKELLETIKAKRIE